MTAETPAPYDGCSRECSEGHTYEWGRCELGVQPPPTLRAFRTYIASDGELAGGFDTFPLALFLPWTVYLPAAEQRQLLAELADTPDGDRPSVLAAWCATAGSLADPTRRDVLLGQFDPADFVEAERPGPAPHDRDDERHPKFGEPFPTLPIGDFHSINTATIHHAPTTNENLIQLIRLRPTWETLAPSSVTPHLLRRILSDDTAISVLTDNVAQLRDQLVAANGRADQAETTVRLLREGQALTDRQRNETDAATRAELEAAMDELRTERDQAKSQLEEIGNEWQVRYKISYTEWTEPIRHEASARGWLADFKRNYPGKDATLMHRRRGDWHDVEDAVETNAPAPNDRDLT